MVQIVIILLVIGLISFALGKMFNKDKNDEAALVSGCGILASIVVMLFISVFIYAKFEKNNPNITEERIQNDLVSKNYVSTISLIENIEIVNIQQNDDLLEIKIKGEFGPDYKITSADQTVILKYQFRWLRESLVGWTFDEAIGHEKK